MSGSSGTTSSQSSATNTGNTGASISVATANPVSQSGSSGPTGSQGPATSNPFRTTYGNPYAIGLSSVSTTFSYSSSGVSGTGFATPIYGSTSTTGNVGAAPA